MAEDAQQLAEAEGVPVYRAEKALKREDGNYEQARQLLREAPIAIKGRFASKEDDIYGLVLLKLNIHPPSLQKINVLVGNDRGIGNVKLSLSIKEFDRAIDRLTKEKGKMTALTQELAESIQKEFSPPSGEWLEMIRSREELDLQDRLSDHFAGVLGEEEVMMTITLESGLLGGESPGGTKQSAGEGEESAGPESVELLCDVRVSPVRGEPVKNISAGDPIFVTLKQQQPEHKRLIDIIRRLEDDDVGMIPAPVIDISRTKTGKLEFLVQFGENVQGKVVAGEDMNILTPQSVEGAGATTTSDSFLWWMFLFFLLMAFGLAILYALLL